MERKQGKAAVSESDLNQLEKNALTSLTHVTTTDFFAVSQHTITTEKLGVCPSKHEISMWQHIQQLYVSAPKMQLRIINAATYVAKHIRSCTHNEAYQLNKLTVLPRGITLACCRYQTTSTSLDG